MCWVVTSYHSALVLRGLAAARLCTASEALSAAQKSLDSHERTTLRVIIFSSNKLIEDLGLSNPVERRKVRQLSCMHRPQQLARVRDWWFAMPDKLQARSVQCW